jgi:prevent-host-death family protein
MVYTVPATQVKNKFGEILRRVYSHRDHIIVEKSGIAVAAIIPVSLYSPIYAKRRNADPGVSEKMAVAEEMVDFKLSSHQESMPTWKKRKVVIDDA